MKRLMLLLFVFIPAILYGQDAEKSFISKCSISISISPDVTGRTIFANKDEEDLDEIVDEFKQLDKPLIGYSGGVGLNYKVTDHFSVGTGLLFSNKGFGIKKFKMDDLYFGDQIDPRSGYVYQTLPNNYFGSLKSIRFVYNYYYLDVPFRFYYTAGEKRLRFVGGLGITANFLLESKQSTIYVYSNGDRERITRDQPNDFAKFNLSSNISAGVDYKLNNQFNIKLEPIFNYGLIKIIDTPVSSHLWSAGLNFSIYYNFN